MTKPALKCVELYSFGRIFRVFSKEQSFQNVKGKDRGKWKQRNMNEKAKGVRREKEIKLFADLCFHVNASFLFLPHVSPLIFSKYEVLTQEYIEKI